MSIYLHRGRSTACNCFMVFIAIILCSLIIVDGNEEEEKTSKLKFLKQQKETPKFLRKHDRNKQLLNHHRLERQTGFPSLYQTYRYDQDVNIGWPLIKNILIPIVTIIGLEFGSLIAFSTVTETVFAWPGMGKLIIDSIYNLDRPVIVAYLMIIVIFFVFLNLLVDILYTLLDPRVRVQGSN